VDGRFFARTVADLGSHSCTAAFLVPEIVSLSFSIFISEIDLKRNVG